MLVSKDYIVVEAFSRRVSESRISDGIINACEIKYLRAVLGTDFYDAVVATPSQYTTLLVFIKPMLAWYVRYMLLPELRAEISDLGINTVNIQSASAVDTDTYAQLRDQSLVVAEVKRKLLIEYLEDNLSLYPLYSSGETPDNQTEIVGGVLFRKPTIDTDEDQWYKPLN